MRLGTIDEGHPLEAVIKFSDQSNIVSVLADMDMRTLAWMKKFVIADNAAEKILDIAIQRKKNNGLHERREAWMSARKTGPLPHQNESEATSQETPSDPGPQKRKK